ncbi:probable 4-coumarate--CoA ligase 3 [Panulirus ornatus]|uniref:probable 4-coumarate--CoA ligase 3 n=1 Tax=Panulirus ornatus TaxID=150431 RepID=UPI003A849853
MKLLTSSLLSIARGAHGVQITRLGTRACATPYIRTITTESRSSSSASTVPTRLECGSEKYILESPFPDMALPYSPFHTKIFQDSHKWSHKTAVECGLTGRSYTYGQLVDAVMKFGGMIQQLKASGNIATDNGNTTVALLSPNCPEYPIMFFGSAAVGATPTTINSTYTSEEVANQLADSDAVMLVVDEVLEPLANAALKSLQRDIPVVVNGVSTCGRPNLRDIIADPNTQFARHVDFPRDTLVCLPYSSGTTGKPKGVCLSHYAFSTAITIFHNQYTLNIKKAEGEHQDVLMGLLPFFHIYGMMVIMSSGLANGAKIVTLPKFDPKSYVNVMKNHKISSLHLVPPLLKFTAMSPMVTPADLGRVHSVLCGAAPVPTTAATLLREKALNPIHFQEGYGLTETLCSHMTPLNDDKLGYSGKLIPNVRAKVLDLESGATLPAGVPGELYLHTPAIMLGYHKNQQATREVIDEDGWFRTGDIVAYDEEGSFTVIDRIKELIKVKGLQVSPSELEDVLLRHPGVADVGIVGVEDEQAGELPRAYVVPRGEVTQQELNAFMKSRLAPHKQLDGGIRFVEQLPKNATGKLIRRELKKMAQQD